MEHKILEDKKKLLEKRDELFKKYDKLQKNLEEAFSIIEPILEGLTKMSVEEDKIVDDFVEISKKICEIDGHKLSEKTYQNHCIQYKVCLFCGEKVYTEVINNKDSVITHDEEKDIKHLIKKHKIIRL